MGRDTEETDQYGCLFMQMIRGHPDDHEPPYLLQALSEKACWIAWYLTVRGTHPTVLFNGAWYVLFNGAWYVLFNGAWYAPYARWPGERADICFETTLVGD